MTAGTAGNQRTPDPPPTPLSGTAERGFEKLAEAFGKLMARGPRGGALVVRADGRVLVDLCSGWADAERTRRWERDTQAMGFSASKGLAAMVIHRLADRGLIAYDEPVASFWPEFAAAGKERITVRQLLSHQAALFDVRAVARSSSDLLDHLGMEERLAAAAPAWPPGHPPAYHALTFGWLCAGLARGITGRGMAELVREELAGPLGTPGLEIGRPRKPAAQMVGNSLRLYTVLGDLGTPLLSRLPARVAGFRALHAPGLESLCRGTEPAIWDTEMPAVNGALSADGLARLYEPLANGGEVGGSRFLSAETVAELGQVQTRATDRALGVRMRWRLGFHQAFGLGHRSPRGLGHFGFGGCGGWADPDSGLSFGYVSNHIGTLTTAIGDLGILRLSGLARTCAAEALASSNEPAVGGLAAPGPG